MKFQQQLPQFPILNLTKLIFVEQINDTDDNINNLTQEIHQNVDIVGIARQYSTEGENEQVEEEVLEDYNVENGRDMEDQSISQSYIVEISPTPAAVSDETGSAIVEETNEEEHENEHISKSHIAQMDTASDHIQTTIPTSLQLV